MSRQCEKVGRGSVSTLRSHGAPAASGVAPQGHNVTLKADRGLQRAPAANFPILDDCGKLVQNSRNGSFLKTASGCRLGDVWKGKDVTSWRRVSRDEKKTVPPKGKTVLLLIRSASRSCRLPVGYFARHLIPGNCRTFQRPTHADLGSGNRSSPTSKYQRIAM